MDEEVIDPAQLAAMDQAHAAGMRDLDDVVAQVREHVQQYGSLAAAAIVAATFEAAMEAGETIDLLMVASMAIARLAEVTLEAKQ